MKQSDEFLNSFFVRDLKNVSAEVHQGNLGKTLSAFLTSETEANALQRDDVRQQPSLVWNSLSPELYPQGRWPTPDDQSLYASQQSAINLGLAHLHSGEGGLFAINGPPGTGKTTLLRELIASVTVERAKCLAALQSPRDAFNAEPDYWKTNGYSRTISPWKTQFFGFEIVIASSNNGAVDNVTLEIPGAGAIDPTYAAFAKYFPNFATRVLQKNSWALIAARLGKKQNCRDFCDRFWFADKNADASESQADKGFLHYLKNLENAKPNANAWKDAVKVLEEALAQEQVIRQQRLQARTVLEEIAALQRSASVTEVDLQGCRRQQDQLHIESHAAQSEKEIHRAACTQATDQRGKHRTFKPGILEIALTLGKAFREWRTRDLSFAADIDAKETRLKEAQDLLDSLHKEIQTAAVTGRTLAEKLTAVRDQLTSRQTAARAFKEQLGAALPDVPHWFADEDARELSSPWADEKWNQARTRVFIAALHLHRVFVECNAKQIRQNLHGAIDLLQGKVPAGAPLKGVESAWATLFFLIPVVSTTFASFGRLFARLGRESLGWLLIDEAGQALPQAAAGALWRSQRAVVVGDPLQLEPISNLPYTAQQALRKHFAVEETWVPADTSVQKLADRVNRVGTFVKNQTTEEAIWVGSPLRVHRRCAKNIFDISNQIAYDCQMKFATPPQSNLPLPPSQWFPVAGPDAQDHWIAAEGTETRKLLDDLLHSGVSADNILLLSPFRTVARKLQSIGKQHGVKAGTIHIAQGKEKDVIVLVLGGHPQRSRAKEWASEKPNLLNVAVSRAKQRLYVIGNLHDWSSYPYFADAAAALLPPAELSHAHHAN